ncbi:MAG: hypothetical protein JWM95_5169 [Gemmatimonadetes bacterium]|nr:hypothetical protein [Gemmatimonadota bacterium]
MLAAACADKNVPESATVSQGQHRTADSAATKLASDTMAPASAPATATTPAPAAVTRSVSAGQADLPAGELPKRSRRDSVALASMTKPEPALDKLWPVPIPEPLPGSLLPANRIVAFYGNPAEKRMGVLGEYPKDVMLSMLDKEVARWKAADPSHPVIPALHLVATVAQGDPGKNGMYRLRMRDAMVNDVYGWAKAKKAIFFIDVQLGKSNVKDELPRFLPWLENPDVHLAIDPEFAMEASGAKPSTRVGTLDAKDINFAVNMLDSLVKAKNLPPKILIVHRWTRKMVTNAKNIKFTPHVQVVMDMDGWGPPWLKFDSYHDYVKEEPVEFTGFKLFFHNDTKKGDLLLTPGEVLRLNPRPLYIQYQ